MKTNLLFLLAAALIATSLIVYVIITVINIAGNPVWENIQPHITTGPLALAAVCYLIKMADGIIKETKTAGK